jgi:hypothetical protein
MSHASQGNAHGGRAVTALIAAAACAAVVLLVAPPARAASEHPGGIWALGRQVELALLRTGTVLPTCSGRGAHRYGPSPSLNPSTWLYRHFECVVGDPTSVQLCVHTLRTGRLVVYRHSLATSYRPCRF